MLHHNGADGDDCAISHSVPHNHRILVHGEMKVQWLQTKLISIFSPNRGLAEVEHPPDLARNASLTTKGCIQSPLGEKLLIIYFWIEKAGA